MNKKVTIDQICKGLRILEKYNPKATVLGKNSAIHTIELQELEFKEITHQDYQELISLNWETNNHYLWTI